LGKFPLPGALFDHMPFADHGYDAVSLVAIARSSLAVHTPRDAVDKLHRGGFERAGRVTLQVIQELLATGFPIREPPHLSDPFLRGGF